MINDVYENPGINDDEESDQKYMSMYLNEMTQDVIEWDESKNMDLGQMFKSPQPPSNESSRTPYSLGEIPKRIKNKRQAKNEPQSPNTQTNSKTTGNSLAQRNRRRRLGYPQGHQNERTTSPLLSTDSASKIASALLQPKTSTVERNVKRTKDDDFTELLEAITTPTSSSKSGQRLRAPLSLLNQNTSKILTLSENNGECPGTEFGLSMKSVKEKKKFAPTGITAVTKTRNIHSSPLPVIEEIPLNTFVEDGKSRAHQYLPAKSKQSLGQNHDHLHSKGPECDTDEFGDIEFSEDDLANIDSLTKPKPSASKSNCSLIELPFHRDTHTENRTKILTKTTPPLTDKEHSNDEELGIPHSECTKEASDEFEDFSSDIDFASIDALVPIQPLQPKLEKSVCLTKSALQLQETKPIRISDTSASSKPSSNLYKQKRNDTKEEDEDEFGFFPFDVDFSQMDALVDSQCRRTKPVDPKISEKDLLTAGCSKKSKPEDEFGDFPDDIDFSVLDQVVNQKLVVRPNVVDPHAAVRNQRANTPDCGGPSFMKFSRYKVLTVETDKKRCSKSLRVASWIDSMIESDEVLKKIINEGKIERSASHVPGDEGRCIFTCAENLQYPEDGLLYLCGEWSFTPVKPGDIIHICSLTGQFKTDASALPIVLHSYPPPGSDEDDLILVLHPDMLMTPSIISETSSCNRRAALKSKLGSSGISSKSAFVGTMRHGLFEACMSSREFDISFAQRAVKNLIREKAELLIGCNISESETEDEVLSVLPMIQQFSQEYTTLRKDIMRLSSLGKPIGGVACHPDIRLSVTGVHSVEETIVSTSLGLKGSIDAVLETESLRMDHKQSYCAPTTVPYRSIDPILQQSLMCLELKTGHNQNVQNVHMAQLSLYTLMLQNRYGAHIESDANLNSGSRLPRKKSANGGAPGGILLYLNDKSTQICHVSPRMNEVKTLMSQRNVVASDSEYASRPRGIVLSFEEGGQSNDDKYLQAKLLPAPSAELPELKTFSSSCNRCYSNRECMLYAASDSSADLQNHREILARFVGHLKEEDLAYFRKWDRLIDIEAKSTSVRTLAPWRGDSDSGEMESGESMSGMIFDSNLSRKVGSSRALACFRREGKSCSQSSFENMNIASGSHVVVSIDENLPNSFTASSAPKGRQTQTRTYIMKGFIDHIKEDKVFISMTGNEMNQLNLLTSRRQDSVQDSIEGVITQDSLLFRLEKSNNSIGTGTLRWNLVNFLTSDYAARNQDEYTEVDRIKQRRLAWLRDVVIRLKAPEFADDPQPSLFRGIDLQIPGCNLLELSEEFNRLNDAQQKAVKMAMSGRDYTLIQGLPGTGKTSTLGFLARLLVARGRRVLITAYTHSAVDNIMSKLIDKGVGLQNSTTGMSALVRLGNRRPSQESVSAILHSQLALALDRTLKNRDMNVETSYNNTDYPSASSLKEVVASSRILGVSALSLPRSPVLQNEIFDVVIIDEAGQMNEPTALGALAAADSFVLVGDHRQLPPLVTSSVADSGGYGISVFKRLADQHPHAIAQLTMQYRMNEAICKISSESMYEGQMQCSDDKVGSQILKLPGFPTSLPMPAGKESIGWLHSVVNPERPVIFLDTDNLEKKSDSIRNFPPEEKSFVNLEGKLGRSVVNRTEAKLVWCILEAMQMCGHDLSHVGVISPFRAQIKIIEDNPAVLSWKKKGLELSTIDKFQGRDKSTIVISLVRSNQKHKAGRLLQDARRLNVAFTRAKCKLIVIGSFRTLSNGSAPLKSILYRMDSRKQRFQLPSDAIGCYKII